MQPAAAETLPLPRYRWTRRQYEQMIEAGVFDEDAKVELIDGHIVAMSPQRSRHATGVFLMAEALRAAYAAGYMVRTQLPLAFEPDSEPEPDVAVVAGQPRAYRDEHPTTAILVVGVAESSVRKDRTQKLHLYARHRIPEYWILNVAEESLEIYRDSVGETYQSKTTLHRGDAAEPPQSGKTLSVADVLP